MTILYSLVSRGTTVLAEFTATSGNFPTITRVLLGKIPQGDGKLSYMYDQYIFHYIVENNIVYLCMCDDTSKRRVPFAFLEDIKKRFQDSYGERAQTAIAFAMSEDFGRTLQKQMDFFNGPGGDSFAQVNSKLDDVKNVMVQNIEQVLERGEKLELLVDKTEKLQASAFQFVKGTRALKMAMFWRRVKMYLLIFFIILVICVIISAVICGIGYEKCKKKN